MKRMLINATQPEELRVALVDGQELYDLDVEVPSREQKKANIYKGRVARIEPSLEACFVEYGAERHGFLPLRQIAPDYHHAAPAQGQRLAVTDAVREGQEVIVQVEKEERGSKGAALTTYVTLAGRYLVLMPNNPRAGGVSRRIEGEDRDEIREILSELPVPDGMGAIVRTAGVGRNLEQIKWDLDYLVSIWEAIRQAAEARPAPFLIYQESNVIIRALRDHFTSDIGEILVDDARVYEEAHAFVEMVMPQQLPKLKLYEDRVPLFTRFQIESYIDAAYQRLVRLPSGGAVVFDAAEALVAVDVNSARATQGSDIKETALNTNLEAADEIARQLRVRDLGGLVVVDFIDMESTQHIREVEQRLNKALELDRARVQVGRISRFGLLELSRQRLRPSLGEAVLERCPRCEGKGMIRSIESLAISVLRLIQEDAVKERTARVVAELPVEVATYLINEKRAAVAETEARSRVSVVIIPNPHMDTPAFRVERIRDDQLAESMQQPSHTVVETPEPAVLPVRGAHGETPAVSNLRPGAPPPQAARARRPGWFARLIIAMRASKTRATQADKPEQKPAQPPSRGNAQRTQPRGSGGNRRVGNDAARTRGGRDNIRRNGVRKPAPEKRVDPAYGKTDSKPPEQTSPRVGSAPLQSERRGNGEGVNVGEGAGSARSRTRRGHRGGRRRRGRGGADGGGAGANRLVKHENSSAETPLSGSPSENENMSGRSSAAETSVPPASPNQPGERRERVAVSTSETPHLAALYEREQAQENANAGENEKV
ncbi:MAG: Rne/Rng family ribonuclease [Gammaproteobacteria bacterium]